MIAPLANDAAPRPRKVDLDELPEAEREALVLGPVEEEIPPVEEVIPLEERLPAEEQEAKLLEELAAAMKAQKEEEKAAAARLGLTLPEYRKARKQAAGSSGAKPRAGGAAPSGAKPGGGRSTTGDPFWTAEAPDSDLVGQVKANRSKLAMAAHILRRDPKYRGKLWFDAFKRKAYLFGRDVEDLDAARLVEHASRAYDECIGVDPARAALDMVAAENERDPLNDYLTGLVWDGQKRLRELLPRGFGAAAAPAPARAAGADPYDGWTAEQVDGELTREMGRRWMIQAVWRALRPGCKADVALVVFGGQGVGKSTGFEELTGAAWFSDNGFPIGQDDIRVSQNLREAWVHELAELTDVRRAEVNKLKAFVTRRVEIYIPKHGRKPVNEPRRCVFVGTTNEQQFLKDPTGERRWWPVEGGAVDLDWIRANRDQLWAEAVYVAGKGMEEGADAPRLRYWFSDLDPADTSLIAALAERHGDFAEEDAWTPIIEKWLAGKPVHSVNGVSTGEVLTGALDIPASKMERHHESRVGACMKRLRWEKKRQQRDGRREYLYFPRGAS